MHVAMRSSRMIEENKKSQRLYRFSIRCRQDKRTSGPVQSSTVLVTAYQSLDHEWPTVSVTLRTGNVCVWLLRLELVASGLMRILRSHFGLGCAACRNVRRKRSKRTKSVVTEAAAHRRGYVFVFSLTRGANGQGDQIKGKMAK
jgi:hypothetical protein